MQLNFIYTAQGISNGQSQPISKDFESIYTNLLSIGACFWIIFNFIQGRMGRTRMKRICPLEIPSLRYPPDD